MNLIFTGTPAYSSTSIAITESIVEQVERIYPTFVQTIGKDTSKHSYLLNIASTRTETRGPKVLLMRSDSLSKFSKDVLGARGCARFDKFKEYEDGWDGANGKKLSLASVSVFELFMSKGSENISDPSLFLSKRGNLMLAWEDVHGKSVEIEFSPSSFHYYLENNDNEGSYKVAELDKLIQKVAMI